MLTESGLMERCRRIEGFSLGQLANTLQIAIPAQPLQRKGWAGMAIEKALGATAGGQCLPDFVELGIELKTLPINAAGKPAESTFVTSIPLLTIQHQTWDNSQCWSKLKRVLWMTLEADPNIPYIHRRVGQAILWSPSMDDQSILSQDWTELTNMIILGRLHELHAGIGEYLQVRPKAADAASLCYGFDEQGQKIQTLPRGFYLRQRFTANKVLGIAS